jgi:dienelactone hydrolase
MGARPGVVALALWLLGAGCAWAQMSAERLAVASQGARDLEFPSSPSDFPSSGAPAMALYKPEGKGPFPALVLVHQCAGLSTGTRQNASMLAWAKEAVARGYVALLIDSLGPRGVAMVCYGPKGGVNFARGVKDALQAAEHLRRFDFVDPERVAIAGFSWGAMVALLASSRLWSDALAPGKRFAAAVSFYPGCFTIRPPFGAPYEIVNADLERPVLVLMGEKDNETPAGECVAKLERAKNGGAPVQWHVYPEATHCWDCTSLDGFSKIDFRGNRVVYRSDPDVTRDSARRMFEFLQRIMSAPAR